MATATKTSETAASKRTPTFLEQAILVDWYHDALQNYLGSPEAVDAFVTEIFTQARKAPKLYTCTVESTRLIVARVASLRLNPAIPNEVALIPRDMKQQSGKYATEMTVIYGYAGLRKLAMRSPEVKDVLTVDVRVNDDYRPAENAISLPYHRLPPAFQPRGRVIGYYAAVELTNGNWRTWSMSVAEVEAHAKRYVHDMSRAPAWNKGERPDVEDGLTTFDKMALKTCERMLLNGRDVPLTAEVSYALAEEERGLRVETNAEHQGYTREGNRPALTMGTGTTMEELMHDLTGGQDEVQEELKKARTQREKDPVVVEKTISSRPLPVHRDTPDMTIPPGQAQQSPNLFDPHQEDHSVWRQILRANLSFLPSGELRSECVTALAQRDFSEKRGNELANIAADMAPTEDR